MTKNIQCAIYARYSTNNQREASIEDQIRKCRELAASKGWEVMENHVYYDKAQSGTQTKKREAFKEMMGMAMSKDCAFSRIIVDDTSRIARNTKEALDIFTLLTFYGIHVFYVSQGIDTSHEAAEEMITINGLIDSLYIRNLAKETHRGIEGQVIKGYSGGGRRYGYRSEPVYNGKVDIYGNPEAAGYILKINPEEAETVIRIFKIFGEDGYSAKKIVNILNQELKQTGSPEPPRGEYWCVSTILGSKKAFRGILNNEIYIGRYRWNRSASKRNPESGKKKTFAKDQTKWLLIDKPELKIIADELWDKAKKRQRYLNEANKGIYRPAYSTNLITGLAKCGQCDGNIVVVSGGKWAKYGCSNNWNKGSAVCSNDVTLNRSVFEKTILRSLNMDFGKAAFVKYLKQRVVEIMKAQIIQDSPQWRGEALEGQLRKTNKEIDSFINAIKAGITSDTVKTHLNKAEMKKVDIERQLTATKSEPNVLPTVSEWKVKRYMRNIHDTLALHPIYGRGFLNKIIEQVTLMPEKDNNIINIYCRKDGILEGKYFFEPCCKS